MSCDHVAKSTYEPWSFVCEKCSVPMCTDCGTTPAHEDSPSQYCRRCAEKGGHRYAFFSEVDHDKLRAKVGRTIAEQIIADCKRD